MTTEKTIRITWRDENYGPVSGALAFRAMVEENVSETFMKKVYRAYKAAGFELNFNRQSWIAVDKPDAPEKLVEALESLGLSPVHSGRVPEELEEPEAPASAPASPRM